MSQYFMRFPEGRKKAVTLSYDDGVEQDMRLVEVMEKYGLKGTFNLNSGLFAPEGTVYPAGQFYRRMTEKQITALFAGSGQEVAVHSRTHPYLEQQPLSVAMTEILEDRKRLEQIFGMVVRGMAYPFGTYSDTLVEMLRASGIVYARTVEESEGFDLPADWLRLKPTCHHGNPHLTELVERFLDERVKAATRLFYLWGHSFEFERDRNWDVIERFGGQIGGQEDIWYAANIEIHDYVEAYHRLIFSADGRLVHNPNAVAVWFELDGSLFCAAPGATVKL